MPKPESDFNDSEKVNSASIRHLSVMTFLLWFYRKTTHVDNNVDNDNDNDDVVIATKGLQDRNINIIAGTTVENKGKLILTEIFPSVQKHDIF